MGGNLFPQAKRMESKQEFHASILQQKELFKSIDLEMTVPRQIVSKTSFGDIDILVPTGHTEQIRAILTQSGLQHSTNGIVLSYLSASEHQIDLIQIAPDKMDYAKNYFGDGDSGNILGRIVKNQFHIKNSFNGLYYVYRKDSDSYSKEFLLSLDYQQLIKLLELDLNKFEQGFDTHKDLFDYIYESPYLDTDIFKLENLNNTNRVRDRKRKFYNEFLAYLADKPKKPSKTPLPLEQYFPDFQENLAKVETEYQQIKAFKQKFNGALVMQLTGLKGKELGDFMKSITSQYTREQIIDMDDNKLKNLILKKHSQKDIL